MVILVDMDDVLADFEGEFVNRWKLRHPEKICIEKENRNVFHINLNYPDDYSEHIRAIYCEEGFFSNLPPVEGGIPAVNEILNSGHEVFLCTSPTSHNEYCIKEKLEWVHKKMGNDWVKRLIITRDKTLVRGDYLIDDNPDINGKLKPEWEHILFDMPYNRSIKDKKRLTWENWKDVLKI